VKAGGENWNFKSCANVYTQTSSSGKALEGKNSCRSNFECRLPERRNNKFRMKWKSLVEIACKNNCELVKKFLAVALVSWVR
jgi:hypothetical protein